MDGGLILFEGIVPTPLPFGGLLVLVDFLSLAGEHLVGNGIKCGGEGVFCGCREVDGWNSGVGLVVARSVVLVRVPESGGEE